MFMSETAEPILDFLSPKYTYVDFITFIRYVGLLLFLVGTKKDTEFTS